MPKHPADHENRIGEKFRAHDLIVLLDDLKMIRIASEVNKSAKSQCFATLHLQTLRAPVPQHSLLLAAVAMVDLQGRLLYVIPEFVIIIHHRNQWARHHHFWNIHFHWWIH